MPMLDAHIPEGALSADAERDLLSQLTDLLIVHEGADPSDPVTQSIAKVWLHRPAAVYVAGAPAEAPHYKLVPSVPEGQYDDERRASMVAAVTDAVLDAEQGRWDRDPMRVWVFPTEVPDGTWGGAGQIVRLADIAGLTLGDPEKGRRYAERVFAERREAATPEPVAG